jgi:hypothetical protein
MKVPWRLLSADAQAVVGRLGITVPTSAAVREAEELAFQASPAELYGHVVRSYLYAATLGATAGAEHDGEMLVAAMKAQAHRDPGGHAALLLGAGLADSARLHEAWAQATAPLDEPA